MRRKGETAVICVIGIDAVVLRLIHHVRLMGLNLAGNLHLAEEPGFHDGQY